MNLNLFSYNVYIPVYMPKYVNSFHDHYNKQKTIKIPSTKILAKLSFCCYIVLMTVLILN